MHRQKTEHPQKTGHLQKMGRAKTTVYAPAAARNSLRPGMGGLLVLLGVFLGGAFGVGAFGVAWAADWPSWRGPEQDGVSRETGLPLVWSPGDKGENLVWKRLEGARSTPVLHDGRVFVVSRIGEGVNEQERVLCAEASTGKLIWEYRFNVFLTDIPSARVGWSSPTVDPETGHVFAHGVQNIFVCLDRSGNVVWERSLHEELGVIMGYGGRTHTPVVDGDFVILSFLNSSWGSQNLARHRYAAFDKKT